MSREFGHVDKHPIHDTKDIFKIGSCVRAKQFVKRVGYEMMTKEEENNLMRHLCTSHFHIPESDVVISGENICGEDIDWDYFPTAYTKYVESKGKEWDMGSVKLGIAFHSPLEIPSRKIPYLERPTREEAKEAFKKLIGIGFKTGNTRQVFYKPNYKLNEIFVVIGKRIAKIGKYVHGHSEFGEYFGPYLEKQDSVQIYTVTKGLYGPTFEVAKDDLILMEYAIPAMPDKDGNEHNWRVCYEWEYSIRSTQMAPSGKRFVCPDCGCIVGVFNSKFVTELGVKPWRCEKCGWSGYKDECFKQEGRCIHEAKKSVRSVADWGTWSVYSMASPPRYIAVSVMPKTCGTSTPISQTQRRKPSWCRGIKRRQKDGGTGQPTHIPLP